MKKTHGCLLVFLILLLSWQTSFAQNDTYTAKDFFQQGVAYENQSVYGEAINMFTAAINLDPYYTEAYLHRGKAYRIYQIANTTKESIDDFTKVIALDPKNAEAYYQRGLVNEYIISNEAAKSDMITAAGLGHEGAQQWLLALNKQGEPVAAPPTSEAAQTPTCHTESAAEQGFDLADYLPGGMQPIVYFDFNKSKIRTEGFAVLDEIATVLKQKLPAAVILVVGHTDSTGTEKYNAGLSLRRAEAVQSYLAEKHGIAPERISAEGYGEMAPADSNETAAGRAHNRRAAMTGVQK
jgi:outer membrane protein OmpA-like peptidoglycan-associated protein